jgi:hypothetical protein
MTFSRYAEYLGAVALRDQLVWMAWLVALSILVFLLALRNWPRVRRVALWIPVGAFYAVMAFIYSQFGGGA